MNFKQKQLLTKIQEADKAYYELDEPIMTDKEYDLLRKTYESAYGMINKVSGNASKKLQSFKHTANMNSLMKIKYNETNELQKIISKLQTTDNSLVVEPKLDGLTVVVYGDKFVTRGNGVEGEIIQFPKKLVGKNTSEYPIRGEAFLTEESFQWINEQQKAKNLKLFANARNCASGILRRLDTSEYLDKIDFIAYDVIGLDVGEEKKLQYIKDNTIFNTIEYEFFANNLEHLYDYFHQKSYPIDGLVIKCNYDNSLQKFGSTTHHPNNAFAYKAKDDVQETVLTSIEWQVGKSRLTPVAIFNTVQLEGTAVNKASLSNYEQIKKLDLMIGDVINVEKRNMIIPYVKNVVMHTKNSKPITIPNICPCCGTQLIKQEIDVICPNDNCKGKLAQKLDYMFSKKLLNAKGVSTETISKLINLGKINNLFDIFNIQFSDFTSLIGNGFGERSINNFLNAVKNSRNNVSFEVFIASCCINGIGIEIGKLLAEHYNYDSLLTVVKNKQYSLLTTIKGIGEVQATKLISDEFVNNYVELKKFLTIADNITEKVVGENRKFVITGKFNEPRSFFEELITSHGDKLVNTVSKDTYALIIADVNSTSSKAKKARELGIKLMSDVDVKNMYK